MKVLDPDDFIQIGPTTWMNKRNSRQTLHGREGMTLEALCAEINEQIAAQAAEEQNDE